MPHTVLHAGNKASPMWVTGTSVCPCMLEGAASGTEQPGLKPVLQERIPPAVAQRKPGELYV